MSDFQTRVVQLIPKLRRYAALFEHDRDAADDLVECALKRAVERRSEAAATADLDAWLFAILHEVLAIRFSNTRPFRAGGAIIDSMGRAAGGTSPATPADLTPLWAELHRLSFELRSALLLVVLEGLTYEDVADIQGVSAGTIRSRVALAREVLRSMASNVASGAGTAESMSDASARGMAPFMEPRQAS